MGTGDGMIGKVVGDYHIEKQLGEGGMASVFKGVHPALGQIVAIKMLSPEPGEGGLDQAAVRSRGAGHGAPAASDILRSSTSSRTAKLLHHHGVREGKTFESILESPA